MKKNVLLVKNITREAPGLLENLLKKYNIEFDLIDLYKGEQFPDPTHYNAVFVFGGPDSANDTTPKMLQELEQIKKILQLKIPYMGICLGMQTVVKAAGGTVFKNDIPEIGWKDQEGKFFEINVTVEGQKDPLLEGLGKTLKTFHLHGETVGLQNNMKLLGTGKYCKNQIIKVGEVAYGTQSHFELTPEMFHIWIRKDPDLLKLDQEQLQKDYEVVKDEYTQTGTQLFTNFLTIAKLI